MCPKVAVSVQFGLYNYWRKIIHSVLRTAPTRQTVKPACAYLAQFSIRKPEMRAKSRSLLVTSVAPCTSACAAIQRS